MGSFCLHVQLRVPVGCPRDPLPQPLAARARAQTFPATWGAGLALRLSASGPPVHTALPPPPPPSLPPYAVLPTSPPPSPSQPAPRPQFLRPRPHLPAPGLHLPIPAPTSYPFALLPALSLALSLRRHLSASLAPGSPPLGSLRPPSTAPLHSYPRSVCRPCARRASSRCQPWDPRTQRGQVEPGLGLGLAGHADGGILGRSSLLQSLLSLRS